MLMAFIKNNYIEGFFLVVFDVKYPLTLSPLHVKNSI